MLRKGCKLNENSENSSPLLNSLLQVRNKHAFLTRHQPWPHQNQHQKSQVMIQWYSEKTLHPSNSNVGTFLEPARARWAHGHPSTLGKKQPSDSLMQIHSCVDPLQIGCKKQSTVLHSSQYRATRLSKSIWHILALMRLFDKYNDTTQYRTIYNTRFLHISSLPRL